MRRTPQPPPAVQSPVKAALNSPTKAVSDSPAQYPPRAARNPAVPPQDPDPDHAPDRDPVPDPDLADATPLWEPDALDAPIPTIPDGCIPGKTLQKFVDHGSTGFQAFYLALNSEDEDAVRNTIGPILTLLAHTLGTGKSPDAIPPTQPRKPGPPRAGKETTTQQRPEQVDVCRTRHSPSA